MSVYKRGKSFFLLMAFFFCSVHFQEVTLAAPSLSIYGHLPGLERAAISPSGENIALIGVINDDRRLIVVDRQNKPLLTAPLGDTKVRGLFWAGNDTVLVYKSDTVGLSELVFTAAKTELFSMIVVPLKGGKPWSVFSNSKAITGGVRAFHGIRERDGKYFGYFSGLTLDRSGQSGNLAMRTMQPTLYEVDLKTQNAQRIGQRLEANGRREWIIGADGKVSATLDYLSRDGDWTIRNRDDQRIASGNAPLGGIRLIGLGMTPGTLIYGEEDASNEGVERWYEMPMTGGETSEVLADASLHDVILDPDSLQIVGYIQEGDAPSYKFINTYHQRVINGTMKAFPGLSVHLKHWNDQFDRLIVMTEGPGDPQTWWLVDIKTGQAQDLGVSYALSSKDVAPMRMVRYQAGDGLDIQAVLTLPVDTPARNLPVIVLPHGGPRARDYPGFDWWAQALASRGYAVLQPNFRGSTGYGASFERAGHGEWGRKMQSDISEGLQYLVKEGIADPKRACIMGASYGGYAALAGVTMQQGIYRCAVAVAGVGDVALWASTLIDERGSNPTIQRVLKAEVGTGRDLRTVSPINFVASANAPILLIHGKDDIVVPYVQSTNMAAALRKAGKPVELVTLEGEDHWLSRSTTRMAMLEAALRFVEQHNPVH